MVRLPVDVERVLTKAIAKSELAQTRTPRLHPIKGEGVTMGNHKGLPLRLLTLRYHLTNLPTYQLSNCQLSADAASSIIFATISPGTSS